MAGGGAHRGVPTRTDADHGARQLVRTQVSLLVERPLLSASPGLGFTR